MRLFGDLGRKNVYSPESFSGETYNQQHIVTAQGGVQGSPFLKTFNAARNKFSSILRPGAPTIAGGATPLTQLFEGAAGQDASALVPETPVQPPANAPSAPRNGEQLLEMFAPLLGRLGEQRFGALIDAQRRRDENSAARGLAVTDKGGA